MLGQLQQHMLTLADCINLKILLDCSGASLAASSIISVLLLAELHAGMLDTDTVHMRHAYKKYIVDTQ